MAQTSLGIEYPTGTSSFPSAVWWSQLAASTSAAVTAGVQAAVASAASTSATGDAATLTSAKSYTDAEVAEARQALETALAQRPTTTAVATSIEDAVKPVRDVIDTGRLSATALPDAFLAQRGYLGTTNLNEVTAPGVYRQHISGNVTTAQGYPTDGATGVLEVYRSTSTGTPVQRYTSNLAAPDSWIRRGISSGWSSWLKYLTDRPPVQLGSQHLDTVTTPGYYYQNGLGATAANGYPEDGATGLLDVRHVDPGAGTVIQRLTAWSGDQEWTRQVSASLATAWTAHVNGSSTDVAEVTALIRQEAIPRRSWRDEVQGQYQRVMNSSFIALAVDPRKPNRVWGRTADLAYLDITTGVGPLNFLGPVPAVGGAALLFTDTHMLFLAGVGGSKVGTVWRAPLPAVDSPTAPTWTKVFDLAEQAGGANSYVREQSLAISPTGEALLLEYGNVVEGGPSVYRCPDIDAPTPTWTLAHRWPNSKHGHGVAWINGRWWAMHGDANFVDAGLWTSPDGSAWERATPAWDATTNRRYGINIHTLTIDGHELIVTDSDTREWESVLYWPTAQWTGKQYRLGELVSAPPPYNRGTVRNLTQTSEGNLMWMQIGENGALGPTDSLWISRGPDFTAATLLEEWPSPHPLGTLGNPVECGDYVFFGRARARKEKYVGQ